MEEFISHNQSEIISTIIGIVIFLILKFIITMTIRKIGRKSNLHEGRTKLVIKYISIGLFTVWFAVTTFIWGVNYRELGIIFSSVFAILGVAIFGTWSILSNVTSGIILFFWFPFKIGDKIKILDKDFSEEATIQDIKAFHVALIKENGELLTYPNNLFLQKGILILQKHDNLTD